MNSFIKELQKFGRTEPSEGDDFGDEGLSDKDIDLSKDDDVDDDVDDSTDEEYESGSTEGSSHSDEVTEDESMESADEDKKPQGEGHSNGTKSTAGQEVQGVQLFSEKNDKDEMGKADATKNQLEIWDSLLESRIHLQQALYQANQLPPSDVFDKYTEEASTEIKQALRDSQKKVEIIQRQLLQLQASMMSGVKELKRKQPDHMSDDEGDDDDDEEIPSDDEEMDEDEDDKTDEDTACVEDVSGELIQRHSRLHEFRNSVLPYWEERTRLGGSSLKKGFEAFHRPVLTQISQITADKERLLKRTRTIRSNYSILGITDQQTSGEEDKPPELESHEEIFDDDDFYSELLRDLIQRKTDSISDPLTLSSHWAKVQRSKGKKKLVDTRASKERKLRYNVHTKLVNLMAPIERSSYTPEASGKLFKSLFT